MQNRRRNFYLSLFGGLVACTSRKFRAQFTVPGCFFLGSFITFSVIDYPNDVKINNMSKIINS